MSAINRVTVAASMSEADKSVHAAKTHVLKAQSQLRDHVLDTLTAMTKNLAELAAELKNLPVTSQLGAARLIDQAEDLRAAIASGVNAIAEVTTLCTQANAILSEASHEACAANLRLLELAVEETKQNCGCK